MEEMREVAKETTDVFKKLKFCPFHPKCDSCKGCIDSATCIMYKEDRKWM